MSEQANLGELLQRPGPQFRTLHAEGREWRHEARLLEAFRGQMPTDAVSVTVSAGRADGAPGPNESEEPWRLWIKPPDLMRAEFALGVDMVGAVFRGARWWSWSPHLGARTNRTRPGSGHGIGPGQGLLDPSVIVAAVELEVLGSGEALGRPVHRARAHPIASDDFHRRHALVGLGLGADDLELLVDQEFGFLIRSEARLRGEPFRVIEMTTLEVNAPLPDGIFTLELPPGVEFEDFEPPSRGGAC